MSRLVLGDQLSPDMAALRAADRARDVVVMAEVAEEAGYVPHHPKKIAFIFAAMRKFAARLREDGWQVEYTRFDDTENACSIVGELLRRAEQRGASEVLATEPGEWRLIGKLRNAPLKVEMREDDRFLASHTEFEAWADGRKALRRSTRPRASSGRSSAGGNTCAGSISSKDRITRSATCWARPATCRGSIGAGRRGRIAWPGWWRRRRPKPKPTTSRG